MNKLIKELAEQSNIGFWFSRIDSDTYFQGDKEETLEKFAKLIVQECVARIQGCHLAESYDPEIVGDFELGYKKAIDKASSQVLLHFGDQIEKVD